MFGLRRGRAASLLSLVTLIALLAGCAAMPPQQGAPLPSAPTAAPVAAAATAPQATQPGPAAPTLDGAWDGTINVANQQIVIKLNFKGQGGTIDIPAQGARELRIENFSLQGDQVKFQMLPKPSTATFTGTVTGDKMSGAYEQAGFKGTWDATRAAASAVPTSAAKGYKEEEVSFKNGQYTLAGTLSLPQGAGQHPAVVLISGSGAQNRDEEIFGFKPFALLADALTKKGIAVLRYDDRGIGGSTTGTVDDTSETYAADVSAAFDYLKTREEIDPKKIGLVGHSEGGIIAPMVAAEKGDVAFLVLLAGPGETGRNVIIEQVGAIAKSNGLDRTAVEQAVAEQTKVIDAIVTGQGLDQVKADLLKTAKSQIEKMPESQRQALGDVDQAAQKAVDGQVAALRGAWFKFFLAHDPAAVLEKIHVPVLALFGGKDVQVLAATNKPAIEAACEKGANKDCTTKVFEDANHLFQAAQTGSPSEYAKLKPEFAPGVLDTITSWVAEKTK